MEPIITTEKPEKNLNVQLGLNLESKASLLTQGIFGHGFEGFNYCYLPPIPPKK